MSSRRHHHFHFVFVLIQIVARQFARASCLARDQVFVRVGNPAPVEQSGRRRAIARHRRSERRSSAIPHAAEFVEHRRVVADADAQALQEGVVECSSGTAAQWKHRAADGCALDSFLREAHQIGKKAVLAPEPRLDDAGRGDGGARVGDGMRCREPDGTFEGP